MNRIPDVDEDLRRVRRRQGGDMDAEIGSLHEPTQQQRQPGNVWMDDNIPSDARLTYEQFQVSEAQAAEPELKVPLIGHARTTLTTDHRLVDAHGEPATVDDPLPPIEFWNDNATYGYAFVRRIKRLGHAPNWGELSSYIQYRVQDDHVTYMAPPPSRFVAIKKLNKQVVDLYLNGRSRASSPEALENLDHAYLLRVMAVSGRENPFREMQRMQEFGDNVHILQQIEFLQDKKFLYIVMPHACSRGSLDQVIFHPTQTLTVGQAQCIFVQILRILAYLCKHGLHHRDLSPDNFVFLTPDTLVVVDMAMSVRIPRAQGRRTLIRAMGMFGTRAFMAPEIYHNFQVFDGVGADLWSALLILYCMLTKLPLYRQPDAAMDISFRYYIVGGAITQDAANELIAEILAEVFNGESGNPEFQHILLNQARANLALTEDARTLFHNSFRVNPQDRWTLAQVMESSFCNAPQG